MVEHSKIKGIVQSKSSPALIVDDGATDRQLMLTLCKKLNIETDIAENGQVGLEKIKQTRYSIYLVDLIMPIVDGKKFIEELQKVDPNPVIVVVSSLNSSEEIISTMKLGVYDYILKPINSELFARTMLKALEYKYLKDIELSQKNLSGEKIRSQIEWLNYKDSRRFMDKDLSESKSLYSLKTSLAQGAGFGSLITLIDILKQSLVPDNDSYKVDKQIADMVVANNEYCRIQIEGLNFATDIFEREFELENYDSSYFVDKLPEYIKRIVPFFETKKIKITYPMLKGNYKIKYNEEIMSLIIEELVVNAYKYSVPESTINIITHVSEGYFWVAVKNDVSEKPYGGIPKEYQKLVMEPFFRIHPPDESVAKVERIGFGLGLAVVDYVAKKHGGVFIIHDVKDFTHENEKYCVMAELLIPLWG